MKFNYLWVLFFSIILYYSCKKEETTNLNNLPNYYFGKYHPVCGIVPPCSNQFWLINKDGLVQIGNTSANVFTLRDSLGQIEASQLQTSINQNSSIPIANDSEGIAFNFEGLGGIIDKASTINSSCYTFENATSVPNAINFFVLIPLVDNRFQVVNLNICQDNLSIQEQATIRIILDWVVSIDDQLG